MITLNLQAIDVIKEGEEEETANEIIKVMKEGKEIIVKPLCSSQYVIV